MVDSEVDEAPIHIIAPVCPDYGSDDLFYQAIGGGISPEAEGAIYASLALQKVSKMQKGDVKVAIAVADTEDDIPEIINRCAGGSVDTYKDSCQQSVNAIVRALGKRSKISVGTFTQFFGDEFRQKQYQYEDVMRARMVTDCTFAELVEKTSMVRTSRHAQILGREEINAELSVRYMAQYAALGTLLRSMPGITLGLNYPTSNRRFFNSGKYFGIELSENDSKVVPILGSIVKREK